PDLQKDPRFPLVTEYLKKYGIQSICGFPLTTAHRKIGVLAFGSKGQDAYSERDICFLSLVASEVAVAIDDAVNFDALTRAQAELRNGHERLKLLLDLTNTVASNLDLQQVLRTISSSVRKVMNSDVVSVHLADPDRQNLRVSALDFPQGKGLFQEEAKIPVD